MADPPVTATLAVLLSAASAHGEQGRTLAALAFALVGAKLMGALVERVGQPAVLDELLFGGLLGNLSLIGGPSLLSLESSGTLAILAGPHLRGHRRDPRDRSARLWPAADLG